MKNKYIIDFTTFISTIQNKYGIYLFEFATTYVLIDLLFSNNYLKCILIIPFFIVIKELFEKYNIYKVKNIDKLIHFLLAYTIFDICMFLLTDYILYSWGIIIFLIFLKEIIDIFRTGFNIMDILAGILGAITSNINNNF